MTAAAPRRRPPTLGEMLAFGSAVLALFIFSQGWVSPFEASFSPGAESPVMRVIFFPAYACGLLVMLATGPNVLRTALWSPLVILTVIVAAASFAWSIDADQTLRRAVALALSTSVAIAIASRWDWDGIAEVMATMFAALAVLTLVTALVFPATGRMLDIFPGAWRGLWPEKNAMGGNMAIAFGVFCAASGLVPRLRWLWAGFAVLALFLVVMSTSKTSLLCAILAGGAALFVGLVRRGPLTGLAAVFAAVLGVSIVGGVAIFAADIFFGLLGKDSTLTGRTEIWGPAIRQAETRPLTGFGYGAVWNDESGWGPVAWITRQAGFRAYHAHNSWIAIWLETGFIGLAAWALLFLETVVLALASVFRTRGAWLALPFLVAYSMMSFSETVVYTFNDLRWVIFVIVACKLAAPHPAPVSAAWHAVRPRAWVEPVFRPAAPRRSSSPDRA